MIYKNPLNCSSITTTIDSFSTILDHSRSDIFQRIENAQFKTGEDDTYIGESLLDEFFPDPSLNSPFETYIWFHLSRISNVKYFSDKGILPTGQIVDHVWEKVEIIFSEKGLLGDMQEIRKTIENDKGSRYYNKLNNLEHGPYALLIRETALFGNYCNHYLRCPEIIDDICHDVNNIIGIDIVDEFTECSKPVIVHFITRPPDDFWPYIKEALIYIYNYSICLSDVGSDLSYIGSGQAIKPNQIISIECVQEPTNENDNSLLLNSNVDEIEKAVNNIKLINTIKDLKTGT